MGVGLRGGPAQAARILLFNLLVEALQGFCPLLELAHLLLQA